MTLRQQLLLVSLLALLLPWAGCQFVRETESALRTSQQQMLAGTARAIADSLSQYADQFPAAEPAAATPAQLYAHALETSPVVDGYFEDWPIGESSLVPLPADAPLARYVLGSHDGQLYLFVAVSDPSVVYATQASLVPAAHAPDADRVALASGTPPHDLARIAFAAEAPGAVVPFVENAFGFVREPTIRAVWQDVPGGYQLEARIPGALIGTRAGLVIEDVNETDGNGRRATSWDGELPPLFVGYSETLSDVAAGLVQPGLRLIVTDAAGWRIATAGSMQGVAAAPTGVSRWLRIAYDAVVEDGAPSASAEPDPRGRERQDYVAAALAGVPGADWFRSSEGSEAIVAVAQPIAGGGGTLGAVILQQGTDAILSLTNRGLVRLLNTTLVAMLLVGGGLLGYATWLSRRIRRLSIAAASAADARRPVTALPSAAARDEIGDLSRSFSNVLTQLGAYNEYLRTLASKLSHELRTPLAIVTSSLENLEHESLDEVSKSYTSRARDGAERLRRILGAMSEASRVEELMMNVETEPFAMDSAISSAVAGYRDVYPARRFALATDSGTDCVVIGAPELLMQLLDKLIDNAVSFSQNGDTIDIGVRRDGDAVRLDVSNPGPPLPAHMHGQLFDSMVSVRPHGDNAHLGLGLYVARLIADGHNGRIEATDIDGGVRFSVWLPVAAARGQHARDGARG